MSKAKLTTKQKLYKFSTGYVGGFIGTVIGLSVFFVR